MTQKRPRRPLPPPVPEWFPRGAALLRDRARLQAELDLVIQQTLVTRWRDHLPSDRYQQTLEDLAARRISPHQAVKVLLNGGSP